MGGVCFADGNGPSLVTIETTSKGEEVKGIVLDFPKEIKDFIDAAAAKVSWWDRWGIEGLCRSVAEAERQGKKDPKSHGKLLAGFVKLFERYDRYECTQEEINILAYYLSKFNAYGISLPVSVKDNVREGDKVIRYEILIDPSVYDGIVRCGGPDPRVATYQNALYGLRTR
jgi:hypothetical protein